jgi:Ca2+/Na+ antiporter
VKTQKMALQFLWLLIGLALLVKGGELFVSAAVRMSEVTMQRVTQMMNFPATLGVFRLLLWMLLNDRRVTRKEGAALLVTYSLYRCALVFLAAALNQWEQLLNSFHQSRNRETQTKRFAQGVFEASPIDALMRLSTLRYEQCWN